MVRISFISFIIYERLVNLIFFVENIISVIVICDLFFYIGYISDILGNGYIVGDKF